MAAVTTAVMSALVTVLMMTATTAAAVAAMLTVIAAMGTAMAAVAAMATAMAVATMAQQSTKNKAAMAAADEDLMERGRGVLPSQN